MNRIACVGCLPHQQMFVLGEANVPFSNHLLDDLPRPKLWPLHDLHEDPIDLLTHRRLRTNELGNLVGLAL